MKRTRTTRNRRLATSIAVLAGVAAIAAGVFLVAGSPASSGHFDNGEFSFDYPTGWRTIAAPSSPQGPPNPYRMEVVIGNGDWDVPCESSGYCRPDKVGVAGGRVVVKVMRRVDGPAVNCAYVAPPLPLATRSEEAGSVIWEIRQPGVPNGYLGNVYLRVWGDGTAIEPEVETLVASFRWNPKASSLPSPCFSGAPPPTLGPTTRYAKNGVTFDYPAGWMVLDNPPDGIDAGRLVFAVGRGQGNRIWCFDQLMGRGMQCQEPEPELTGGEVLVFMYERPYPASPAPVSVSSAPPGRTITTVSGLPAHKASGYHWARWWLTASTYIAAYWGVDATDEQPEVQALVDSLKLSH